MFLIENECKTPKGSPKWTQGFFIFMWRYAKMEKHDVSSRIQKFDIWVLRRWLSEECLEDGLVEKKFMKFMSFNSCNSKKVMFKVYTWSGRSLHIIYMMKSLYIIRCDAFLKWVFIKMIGISWLVFIFEWKLFSINFFLWARLIKSCYCLKNGI